MHLVKSFFYILLVLMVFVLLSMSQITSKERVIKKDITKAEAENWVTVYTNTVFVEMNPGGAFNTYFFSGEFTKNDLESGVDGIADTKKKLPKNYLKRYLRLNFERSYYELFFSMGTKGFIENFTQESFDDNGITTISNEEYMYLLTSLLGKHKISNANFSQFFYQDTGTITKNQMIKMEGLFSDLLSSIKTEINKSNYNENVKQIQNMWEIRDNIKTPRYSLVVNKWVGSYIIGKKNGKIQILDFAGGN